MEPTTRARRKYTVEEYFAIDDASQERYEYRDGDIIDRDGNVVDVEMPVAPPEQPPETHLRIERNLTALLWTRLAESPLENFGRGLRVRVDSNRYLCPDQTVARTPLVFESVKGVPALVNPETIFEITARSTEAADRGEKFIRYRTISTVKEYFVISEDQPLVDPFYRRPDGLWLIGDTVRGLDSTLKPRSVPVELRLADLYAAVVFPPGA